MRKLRRKVAKARMKAEGLRQICKRHEKGDDSYFAELWKEYV